ncbi:MAG: thioredoxin-dependent thiol peroxidase [Bacteroidetes bacterium]|jgi:peroxiredoxin Q/BCP|nr:thioredoxin-dependent thiol peroxidase [Bacteroidota bacterium]MBU2465352.1 thioredoxin-dependent thiol peroxidase [Bacteroidota bacterium]MBU2556845.1 thioredoxin-dependent thiol peroxidase [Bacteroidota bacterium]MDA3943321.1 thioredoxin-dependent thiol peroxidase [Bacteroidota bacterium]
MLQQGEQAPDFSAQDQNGNMVSLSDFKGKKLVLYFYPKDNTPGCTKEACNLRDNYADLLEKGFAIVGISPDAEASHKKFAEKFALPFPLLADTELKIIKAYGAWGEKNMYGKKYEGLLRSTFIIDETGKIEQVIKKVKTDNHADQIFKLYN